VNQGNNWKLGLFVVLGLLTGGLAMVALGANQLEREVETFVTYFDESVQGLDVGSPVKFRGVRIGEVGEITVASNKRHVQVVCAVDVKILRRLGLHADAARSGDPDARFVPPELRVQLVPQGITGVRFLQVDYFSVKEHPEPGLGFPTPPNYIPAAVSTLASIEQAIVEMAGTIPDLSRQAQQLLKKGESVLQDVAWRELSERGVNGLEKAIKLLERVDTKLKPVDLAKVQDEISVTLTDLRERMKLLDRLSQRLEKKDGLLDSGEKLVRTLDDKAGQLPMQEAKQTLQRIDGAVASIQSTTRTLGTLARESRNVPERFERSLHALEQASRSIRDLSDLLQRDADMLLKGRYRRN
jgi:phospholipid/cholesterol/gamma-HCH transport system substrate-binding protein